MSLAPPIGCRLVRGELDRCRPESFADVFGAAAAQPARHGTSWRERAWHATQAVRRSALRSTAHNGFASPPVLDRMLPCASTRKDHARRRSVHAQPDAAAPAAPRDVLSHCREHPGRWPDRCRISIAAPSTRTSAGQPIPSARLLWRVTDFGSKLVKVQLQARLSARAGCAKGTHPASLLLSRKGNAQGHCMDLGRLGRARPAIHATRMERPDDVHSPEGDAASRPSRPITASPQGSATFPQTHAAHQRPGRFSSMVPGCLPVPRECPLPHDDRRGESLA